MEKLMLFTILFFIMLESGHCQCSNATTGFRTNLKTLLDLLTKNAPLHDGFYEASVGNNSADQVFGILHCKANISRNDCTNCFRYPIGISDECPITSGKETLSTTCTMKFSDKNFFGIWSNFTIATYDFNGLDDPLVFSKGFSMMQDLASTVPDQPLMYQAVEIDVGVDGKRYGLAQCGRDLSKLGCQNCLEDRLVKSRSYANNRTGWEILGIGCSLWYSNVSDSNTPGRTGQSQIPPGRPTFTSGLQRCHGGIGIVTIISIGISVFTPFVLNRATPGHKW